MTPLLQVEHLSVGITRGKHTFTAVDDIGFVIRSGEILGIVGESGCGKSLTALSIPGLLPEAALGYGRPEVIGGSIRFNGQDMLAIPQQELCRIRGKEISMVFQEPALSLNPLVKTGAQIAETLVLHGEKDKTLNRKRVLELLGSLGLPEPEKLINSYPHQLSGGMNQRVMIAIAVICRPKLLIADEPTTALDVTIQAQILNLMKKINRELGTSILFISHDLGVIRRLCGRVLVMYAGKILESGTVEDVFSNPIHEYTRGLLGSIPGRERKGAALTSIPGKVPAIEETPRGCPFAKRCGKAQERCGFEFPLETAVTGGGRDGTDSETPLPHRVHCILAEPRPARFRQ
ncbi:peptide ABC transporter ATP-binding protein [Spirochaetia bacterium]|nr:peptide ABC transporter ATP-binding protein [Spirochaetia bacterium]